MKVLTWSRGLGLFIAEDLPVSKQLVEDEDEEEDEDVDDDDGCQFISFLLCSIVIIARYPFYHYDFLNNITILL